MQLVVGNIEDMGTDAIVAAAHSDLRPAPGISESIFAAADREALTQACRKIGRCKIGHAVVTPSCGLPCRYIIHVAGAGWYSGKRSERLLFANCYLQALTKASALRCRSVALPLMFSGMYHLPREQAIHIVCQVVQHFEAVHPEMKIVLVLYTQGIYRLAERIFRRVTEENAAHASSAGKVHRTRSWEEK